MRSVSATLWKEVAVRRKSLRLVVMFAAMVGMLAVVSPASAATSLVSLSVDEEIVMGVPSGTITSSTIPGCSSGTVTTPDVSSHDLGSDGREFRGTKVVDCGGGTTLTFTFVARYLSCDSPIDFGRWRIQGGTGSLAGASGGGVLVGNYTGNTGTACDNTGITDNWFGVLRLP